MAHQSEQGDPNSPEQKTISHKEALAQAINILGDHHAGRKTVTGIIHSLEAYMGTKKNMQILIYLQKRQDLINEIHRILSILRTIADKDKTVDELLRKGKK